MAKIQSVGLLCLVVVLGSAAPLRAQALQLNVGPTLNGALGINNFALQATGGTPPYHYTLLTPVPGFRVQDGPPLPTNFTVLPSGTGGFLGVATTSGTFISTIRVTDAALTVLDKPITLNIPPIAFSINPPKATIGVAYSYTFTGYGGSGGAGYSWSATGLPTGLNLSAGGVLSGTPTTGTANAIITLTDSTLSPPLNSLARTVTITVDPFAITTPGLLPNATAGAFYSQTITAPGCPAPCSFTPTSFAGLSLNSAGVLSGTPFVQTGSFTVTATGAGPVSVSKQFTLFVSSPSTPLSSGFGGFSDQAVGNFVTNQILPFGGTPPYTVSVVSGTLPTGISLVGPGNTVCNNCNPGLMYLSGRAMQLGTFNFTLKFMDSLGASFTPAPYTWNISPLSNQYGTLPLAGTTLAVGTPYTQPLLVIGGTNIYSFQAFSALPAGLSLDTNTGVVSGTPTTGGNVSTQVRISEGGIVKFTVFIGFNVSGPPTVVTLPATNVSNTSARLNGTVNPGGFATTGNFEWGTTTAYGNTTSTVNFGSSFFTQNTGTNINITCVAGSVYHYRLVATNSQGPRQGANQTFTCSPQVSTFNAFDITAFGATLNGSVNPNGLATTAQYQWGLTTAYGNVTPLQSVGAGTSSEFIDGGTLTGLQCNTTYHFRATGTNANGTSNGNDVTFTTNPCTPGVFTGVAAVVGQTGATMLGGVVPNGQLTNAHFEWGATTAYGNITPDQAMGSGLEPLLMGAVPITGLVCSTTYHFRTVAENSFGIAEGADRAFTTAPCAATPIKGTVYALNSRYPFTNLIYGYGVTNAGALVQLPGFPLLNGVTGDDDTSAPEQLTYDPSRKRLYAINGTLGTLSVFNVDTRTGALTQAPFSPIVLAGGVLWTTVHVHPSGSPVIVGGIVGGFDNPAATGQVASYVITPTTATPAAGSPFAASVAYVYSSAFSRDGNYLYAGAGDGVGTNPSTAGYAVNPSNGVLTPLAGSPFTLGGSFPIAYATDTGGRLFSATNEDNQIRAFTTSGGIPTAVSGNPFAAPGLNDALSGVVHPAGFYMVAGENSGISVYQIAGSGAATTLTNVAGSPFATGGNSPTSLVLSKDGNLLIANNGESRNLRVFSVNASTGALTPLSTQPFDTLADQGDVPSITFAPSDTAFGDFDSDAKGDLLLRNRSTGQNIGWLMNGLTVSLSAFMPTIADTNWKIAGRGDFDGDSKADVILRNSSTGQNIGWLMNGLTVSLAAFMPTIADTNWEIRGVGDFDGDGKADVILRNKSTGQNIGWLMNGLTVSLAAFMPTIADTNWEIVGVGDFNGDGKADVLLRNRSTGQNIGWLMNGLTVSLAAFMPTIADTNWEIKGVGDFDGDGKADVVLRNKSTGQNIGWLMNGLAVSLAAFMPTIADTNWEIKGAGDFSGDGKADIILRNRSTGQNIGWLMNGLAVSTSAFMPTIADTNWEFVGQGQ